MWHQYVVVASSVPTAGIVTGSPKRGSAGGGKGGVTCASHLDHRIAMSFLILGMASEQPVSVDDGGPIATSFPIFEPLMGGLGADLRRTEDVAA